ncbi:MAG TPA: hypothetical protein VEX62_04980 [Candidatus Limnocylindrales bacterium]|nr:hypothetical protein [Candidatus Limnocylindrales bacterium]
MAAAAAGGRVALVGSVGDDADGDAVAIELGRAGIGHAALLRDPAGTTPRSADLEEAVDLDGAEPSPLPRLDAADIDLGLRYLAECQVLVVAEPLDEQALDVAASAARYHGAALIVVTEPGSAATQPEEATVIEMPDADGGAFAELVGRYAALLDSGRGAAEAWHDAVSETGWQNAPA